MIAHCWKEAVVRMNWGWVAILASNSVSRLCKNKKNWQYFVGENCRSMNSISDSVLIAKVRLLDQKLSFYWIVTSQVT